MDCIERQWQFGAGILFFTLSNYSKFFSEQQIFYFSMSRDHFRFLNYKLKSCQRENKVKERKKVKIEILSLR